MHDQPIMAHKCLSHSMRLRKTCELTVGTRCTLYSQTTLIRMRTLFIRCFPKSSYFITDSTMPAIKIAVTCKRYIIVVAANISDFHSKSISKTMRLLLILLLWCMDLVVTTIDAAPFVMSPINFNLGREVEIQHHDDLEFSQLADQIMKSFLTIALKTIETGNPVKGKELAPLLNTFSNFVALWTKNMDPNGEFSSLIKGFKDILLHFSEKMMGKSPQKRIFPLGVKLFGNVLSLIRNKIINPTANNEAVHFNQMKTFVHLPNKQITGEGDGEMEGKDEETQKIQLNHFRDKMRKMVVANGKFPHDAEMFREVQ